MTIAKISNPSLGKKVLTLKKTASLSITPTTAAVIPISAAWIRLFEEISSIYGANEKMKKKLGRNVTKVVSIPPAIPYARGFEAPENFHAPRKPTY